MSIELCEIELIRDLIHSEISEHYLDDKYCPICKADTTLLKINLASDTEFVKTRPRYRCMNCLTLFEVDLKEVKQ